jgi:hypothetical protein
MLASDSRETGDTKRDARKHFRQHDYVVGTAGDCSTLSAAEHILRWPKVPTVKSLTKFLHTNFDAGRVDFEKCSMLVVTHTKVFVCDGMYVYEPVPAMGAIGSGAPYALGYLRGQPEDLAGAVAAACFHDPWCSGPVREIPV